MSRTEVVQLRRARSTAGNPHKVSAKQWAKWGPLSRSVFNELYSSMLKNQVLYTPPDLTPIPRANWRVITWNAAFMAADAVRLHERQERAAA